TQLSFGNYHTSKAKAGWTASSGNGNRNSNITTEERLLKAFNISRDNISENIRNKYQFTIHDGELVAEVYCLEKISKEGVAAYSRLGSFSSTKNFQYSFSAAILPQTIKDEPWQLVFYSSYDSRKDTTHKFWERSNIEREGYVTNGKIRIDIRPIITDRAIGKDGAVTKTLFKLLMAYELKIDGGLIGVID